MQVGKVLEFVTVNLAMVMIINMKGLKFILLNDFRQFFELNVAIILDHNLERLWLNNFSLTKIGAQSCYQF